MKLSKFPYLFLGGIFILLGCAPVDVLNATIPTSGYSIIKDLTYADHNRGKLDIYIPDHPAAGRPVVVFYYGGSWKEGSKDDYLFVGQAFASKGFVTVIADYRVFPEVYFPTFMEDVAAAFVWTHRHIREYGGDPGNMFVAGHSAGAYNAIMLTLNRDYLRSAGGKDGWIRGAIGISGPYDFLPLTDPVLIRLFGTRDIAATQPINFVRPNVPPILLLTGDADEEVLPANSEHMANKLAAFGDPVTRRIYPDIAHIGIILAIADGFRSNAPVLDDCAAFIASHTTDDK